MGFFKPNIDKLFTRRDVAGLIRALSDTDSLIRLRAANALGQLGDDSAAEPLAAMLDDVVPDARFVAATALAMLGDHRAVGTLVEAAGDADPSVRFTSAEMLGALKDASAADALLRLLGDDSTRVRNAATAALARLRGSAATNALIAALADPDRRELALAALAEHPRAARDRAVRLLATQPDLAGLRAGRAVQELAVTSADALVPLLADVDPATRVGAAEMARALAGDAERERAIGELVEGLERDADVETLLALGSCLEVPAWDTTNTPRWRQACFGPELRRRVVEALGRLGDPRATDVVAQQLEPSAPDRESEEQRRCTRAAIEALRKIWDAGQLRDEGRSALLNALASTDRHNTVATTLAEIGDTGSVHLLLEGMQLHPEIRGRLQPLLTHVQDIGALAEGLRSSSEPVAAMTITALERIGVAATQPLIDLVRRDAGEPNLRAVQALAKVGDRRAVEPLLEILASAHQADLVWAATAGLVARGHARDVVDQLERSGSASVLLRLIEDLPKALDAELLTRAGQVVLSKGVLTGFGLWDRVEHLLAQRVRGGSYVFDGSLLHDLVESWLQQLETIESRHWGGLPEWDALRTLLQKRLDAFDDGQLQRVIDLHPIDCDVWGGDEREMGGATYTYDPEPLRQLAKAELRRRGRAA